MLYTRRIALLTTLITTAAGGLFTTESQAGEYQVNTCRHADGSPAPTDGASFTVGPNEVADVGGWSASENCAQGGSIRVAYQGGSVTRRRISWNVDASSEVRRVQAWTAASQSAAQPSTTTSMSDNAHLCTNSPNVGEALCRSYTDADGGYAERTTTPLGWGSLTVAPLAATNQWVYTKPSGGLVGPPNLSVACAATDPDVCTAPFMEVRGYRFLTSYADDDAPRVTAAPAGADTTVGGTKAPMNVKASDAKGVYSAQALVGGKAVGEPVVVDANGGRCSRQADGSFDYLVPCLTEVDAQLKLDVSQATNGKQPVAVRVVDIAGNATDGPAAEVTVDNTPKVEGGPALVLPQGTLRAGQVVGVEAGRWTPEGTALSYQWVRCPPASGQGCVPIPGATQTSYTLDEGDLNRSVAVTVTGKLGQYSTPATSTPSPAVIYDRAGKLVQGSAFVNPLAGRGHVHNGSGTAEAGRLTASFSYTTTVRRNGKRQKVTRTTAKKSVNLGQRLTVAGRLLGNDGKPIDGAQLAVISTPRGGKTEQLRVVTTRADGRYSFTVPYGPIRKIQVGWFPFGDSVTPVASPSIEALGKARITLTATRSAGGRISLRGRVANAKKGVIVLLQNRAGAGRWTTFASPRTTAVSRFTSARKLTKTPAGTRICIRARVVTQAALPYVSANSATKCVRLR